MSTQVSLRPIHPYGPRRAASDLPSDRLVASARERCVRVKNHVNEFGQRAPILGSGVIMETGLIFTNWHVIEKVGTITVNDHPAQLVHFDFRYDLAALKATTRRLKPVRICRYIGQGHPVFYVGNPDGCNKSAASGHVNYVTRKEIRADTSAAEGLSGSGLYDCRDGELVGIIDSMNGTATTIAIPSRSILAFMTEARPRFRRMRQER